MIRDISSSVVRCFQLHLGGDRNFHYLLADPAGTTAAAIDPGFDPEGFAAAAQAQDLDIAAILVTHGHPDHNAGAARLAELTGAPVLAATAAPGVQVRPLAHGQLIAVGDLEIQALATPGHAPDHFSFLAGDALVTGDLLFCGKVGGTGPYFPGSSAREEWDSLQRVLQLGDDIRGLPGHDYYGGEGVMPDSTIGHERKHNPFLARDFDAFCHLKDNWAAYKEEHGIR